LLRNRPHGSQDSSADQTQSMNIEGGLEVALFMCVSRPSPLEIIEPRWRLRHFVPVTGRSLRGSWSSPNHLNYAPSANGNCGCARYARQTAQGPSDCSGDLCLHRRPTTRAHHYLWLLRRLAGLPQCPHIGLAVCSVERVVSARCVDARSYGAALN